MQIKSKLWIPFIFLLLFFSSYQINVLSIDEKNIKFQRMMVALTLELGVKDPLVLRPEALRDDYQKVLSLGEQAAQRNLSIFGISPIKDIREKIGQPSQSQRGDFLSCFGSFDSASLLEEDNKFFRIEGWLDPKDQLHFPRLLEILDQEGVVMGFAFMGLSRQNEAEQIKAKTDLIGWVGYVDKKMIGQLMTLLDPTTNCQVRWLINAQ